VNLANIFKCFLISLSLLIGQTSVSVYVCMYICMYACIYVCTFVCMYIYIHVVCMYIITYVCMNIYVYVRVYVCMCVCICVYVCVRMYVKYVFMYEGRWCQCLWFNKTLLASTVFTNNFCYRQYNYLYGQQECLNVIRVVMYVLFLEDGQL